MMSLRHFLLIALFIAIPSFALALGDADYIDAWSANNGSSTDAVVWGGYDLDVYASGTHSNADCLCWDWCDGGQADSTTSIWDTCYCKTGKLTQCKAQNSSLTSICSTASGGCGEVTSLAEAHDIDTGSSGDKWKCSVDVKEYVDCDNSSTQKATNDWMDIDGDPYWVVSPKQYDCDGVEDSDYDFEGSFGSQNVDILTGIACPQYKACDTDGSHINHDDILVTSATGSIPNPCSTVDGSTDNHTCTSSNQCLSGTCGGGSNEVDIYCESDGSALVKGDLVIFDDTCGGSGDNTAEVDTDFYSANCQPGKVCDAGLEYTSSSFTTNQICMIQEYGGCSSSSQCWNDNGGYDCMGSTSIGSSPNYNRVCTTGANGKTCFNNDDLQCDSNRCDSTCMAKLSDGSSCNEASDCSAGICQAGICGLGGSGSSCTKDTDCQSKVCVYTSSSSGVCQSSHNPKLDITDSWVESNSNNVSSADDGLLFGGETVYPISNQLRESTDMICYDFDGDGDYDACYFDSNGCVNGAGCSASSCNVSGFTIPQSVSSSKKWSCDIDSGNGCKIGVDNGTPAQICTGSSCSVSTANPIFSNEVKAVGFTDCDDSDSLKGQYTITGAQWLDSHYSVVKPKSAICENTLFGEAEVNDSSYWTAGFNGVFYQEIVGHTCPVNKACDQLSDEVETNTPNGVVSNPCKTIPNQTCTQNSDCLYNSCNTSTNKCNVGIGIEGILEDEFGDPITNKQIKLTVCGGGDSVLKSSTTDSKGRFNFYHVPGSYKLKSSAPWSNEVTYVFPEGPCYAYGEGFHDINLTLYTEANIHGTAVNPQGFASTNLPFEAATCQNVTMDTDTTDSQGNFSLNSDAGYQKVLVTLNGTKFPLTDASGSSCLFQYGDVDLGTQVITDNCPLYNNTCSDDNTRLFDCKNDSVNGCSCKSQYCEAGCTENAPVCNPIGTGTFKVQVLDANGNAVPLAPVYVDYQFSGKTNGFGKKDVNVKHGSHTIKADCPSAPISQTKPSYINSDTKYETFKLNCPTQQKGDLIISVENVKGNPIGNVYVFVGDNNSTVGLTDGFGSLNIPNLPYGEQSIRIGYKLSDELSAKSVSKTINVNQAKSKVSFVVMAPGDVGYSSYSALETIDSVEWIDEVVKEVSVVILGAILPPVDFAVNSADYCGCVYDGAETAINQCLNDIAPCANYLLAGTADPFVSTNTCVSNVQNHTSKLDKCGLDFLFVVGAVIPTPIDNIGKGYVKAKKLEKAVNNVGKLTYDVQNGYTKIEKTVKLIAKTKTSITTLEDEYMVFKKLVVDSQTGKEVFKGGINILKDTTKFTELGADAALDFTKAIKNYHNLTEEGATTLAKNIEKYRPEDAADVFNAMGNLLAQNKDIGMTIDAAGKVGVKNGTPVGKMVQSIEEAGGANIKGRAEEILTANKDIDEFIQFPKEGKGFGDIELTGGRRKQVKSKDLKLYQNQETNGIKDVSDGVAEMIAITKNFPNPTGKHVLQFHNLTSSQRGEILNFLNSEAEKIGITNILDKVDVVSYK